LIKTINKECGKNIEILADLEGHRIRVGKIEGEKVELKRGQHLFITNKDILGNSERISIDYLNPLTDIGKGSTILIDDGNLALKVLSSQEDEIVTEVQSDYILKTHKGVNILDAKLRFEALEDKDRKGLLFALGQGVDYVANSFVRDAADMQPIIDIVKKEQKAECKLVAKIEDMSGINNINEILDVVDGAMVARGDMGAVLPVYSVPVIQKYIIKRCKAHNKFVIVATQMLETMIKNPVPTRAEVSDVANAVLDGTDYTMLSAETSVGCYPEKAVAMMYNVIKYTLENKSKIA
jgi:pyruvate kinase